MHEYDLGQEVNPDAGAHSSLIPSPNHRDLEEMMNTPFVPLYQTAETLLRAGLSVLPAFREGDTKRVALSAWKPYQKRLPSEAEVRAWFAGGPKALCLVCGAVSGHLEMIDFDLAGEAYPAWCDRVQAAAPGLLERIVIETTPSGGYHAAYRCQVPVCGNLKLAQRKVLAPSEAPVALAGKAFVPRQDADDQWYVLPTLIETRGEGGVFLCAPSEGYQLTQGDLEHLPVLTEAERDTLLMAAWELNEYLPTPEPEARPRGQREASVGHVGTAGDRPGDDFGRRGDVRALLERHGWTLVKGGENEYWRRPGKSSGWSATLKDRVFYVFSANAAPFESSRAYSPFSVYTLLEHGGDYQAAAYALRVEGYGSNSAATSRTAVDLSKFLMPAPEPLIEQALPDSIRSLSEAIDEFTGLHPPVIHGLLREGETMNIIAAPKMGKSWLATGLAISMASGLDWLGMRVAQGRVLHIDNELHEPLIVSRYRSISEAMQFPSHMFSHNIDIVSLRGSLRDLHSMQSLFDSVEPGQYKLVIIDAFYRTLPMGIDENDNGAVAGLYNRIDQYAARLKCAFVLIHHTSKGNQSEKSVTDVGAGAGSQSRAADTHLVLRYHQEKDVVVLDAAVRSWPPVPPQCLRWTFPLWSSALHLDPACLKGRSIGGGKKDKPSWHPESFIRTFITEEFSTRSEIIERAVRAGLSSWAADKLLRDADRDGLIERQGEGKRSEPYIYRQMSMSSAEVLP